MLPKDPVASAVYKKRWNAANRERVRESNKRWYAANRERQRAAAKCWYAANVANHLAAGKRWAAANAERLCEQRRSAHLQRKYGLSGADWEKMWSDQEGYCALCSRSLVRDRSTAVDHDAKTGKVRGLLHLRCNTAIAIMDHDSMRARLAVTYLDKHSPVPAFAGGRVGVSVVADLG